MKYYVVLSKPGLELTCLEFNTREELRVTVNAMLNNGYSVVSIWAEKQ